MFLSETVFKSFVYDVYDVIEGPTSEVLKLANNNFDTFLV